MYPIGIWTVTLPVLGFGLFIILIWAVTRKKKEKWYQ